MFIVLSPYCSFWNISSALYDNRPEALLAIADAPPAQNVVFSSTSSVEEEWQLMLPLFWHTRHQNLLSNCQFSGWFRAFFASVSGEFLLQVKSYLDALPCVTVVFRGVLFHGQLLLSTAIKNLSYMHCSKEGLIFSRSGKFSSYYLLEQRNIKMEVSSEKFPSLYN